MLLLCIIVITALIEKINTMISHISVEVGCEFGNVFFSPDLYLLDIFQIVSYEGKALAALKEAMIKYEAKSGRFDETNPWKQDGFKSEYCCARFQMCDEGTSTGYMNVASISITIVTACISVISHL